MTAFPINSYPFSPQSVGTGGAGRTIATSGSLALPTIWNRHRRRIVVCGACALTLGAVELAVRRLQPALRAYDVALYRRAAEGLHSAGPPDIAIMGSSRVRYALDPAVFEQLLGCKAYNIGVSGSKVVEWTVFARRVFEECRPHLVVLGINAGEVRGDYVPTEAARNLFNLDEFLESVDRDGFSLDVAGDYVRRACGPCWKTYENRYELLLWGQERLAAILPKHAQYARELRMRVATPEPPNGYCHPWTQGRRLKNLMQWVRDDRQAVAEAEIPQYDPQARAFDRLDHLLEWFIRRDIRVVVAYIPNSPRTEQRWIAVEPEIRDCIAQVCERRGVPFLQWDQGQLPRTDADYLHETHVGWPLACEISLRITDRVRELALLNDDPASDSRHVALTEAPP